MKNSVRRSIPKRVEAWFLTPSVLLDLTGVVASQSSYQQHFPDPEVRGIVICGRSTWLESAKPELGNVFHEMAHLIEIDDRRVRQPNWGIRLGKWVPWAGTPMGGFYDMTSTQAIQREVRVMAIQAVVTEHCGFNFDYAYWAHLLGNGAVPNHFLWRAHLGLEYADSCDKDPDNQYLSMSELVDASVIRSLREELTIEQVWAEWSRKLAVVERQFKAAKTRRSKHVEL
jgi:hypothetical protein